VIILKVHLASLPVGNSAKHLDGDPDLPEKEPYAVFAAPNLKQTFDLIAGQAVEQFCFNTPWHIALNITAAYDAA
jgi:hypothetical protein